MKLTLCTKTSTLINVTLMVHTYFPKILSAINMAFAFQKLVENLNLYFLCPLRSYPTMTPVLTFPDILLKQYPSTSVCTRITWEHFGKYRSLDLLLMY